MDFKNKTVIVTGAGSGIGRETAIALSYAGAFVVCAGRCCRIWWRRVRD